MYTTCKTQKQLKECVRKTLDKIGVCSSIKQFYPDEWEGFMFLFRRHSDYPDKFHGLSDIQIRYNPIFRTQLETIIVKNNGDEDDVSLLNNCITGKPKDNLTIAMRNAIYPQIQEFKLHSVMECVLCHCTTNIHIDHYQPQFVDLTTAFLQDWNGLLPNTFEQNDCHSKIFTHADTDFELKWIAYHRSHAVLRVLCKTCNLSRKKSV